ncbi:S41 family peptidase [Larkinella sp. VNQ87]|uniref:S41 family peptidase n=1 Tax=Larkinella sp. VNQ87 TaxID=3400921 RepID=UPI003C034B7D
MRYILVFTLFFRFIAAAQAQTLQPAQARADVQYLTQKLEQLHPGLGYYLPKPAYDRLVDSVTHRLDRPLAYQAFYQTITPLITSLKDGHSDLGHRKQEFGKNRRLMPFYIREVGERYYLSHDLTPDSSLVRGSELLAIDQQPIADLHQLLQDTDRSGSDGDNRTGRRFRSLIGFASYYRNWFGPADSVQITYRLPGDTLVRARFVRCETSKVLDANLMKRYRKELNLKPNLSVTVIDSLKNTAVLRVSTFSGNWLGFLTGKYKRQLRRAFREIDRKQIRNLIVDVRSNGGGAVVNSARLLRYWLPEPFRVMGRETMKPGYRRVVAPWYNPVSWLLFPVFIKKDSAHYYTERFSGRPYQPQNRYAFRGNLYFLMNGASYSATASVLAHSLNQRVGTFVGEACGGAYWGDFAGQFKTVTLPHSRLRVRIPLKRMPHAVDLRNANGFTVEPDFPVERSYDDILTGRDFSLVYTLKLIQAGQKADRQAVQE